MGKQNKSSRSRSDRLFICNGDYVISLGVSSRLTPLPETLIGRLAGGTNGHRQDRQVICRYALLVLLLLDLNRWSRRRAFLRKLPFPSSHLALPAPRRASAFDHDQCAELPETIRNTILTVRNTSPLFEKITRPRSVQSRASLLRSAPTIIMGDFNAFGGSDEENAEIKRLNAEIVSHNSPD